MDLSEFLRARLDEDEAAAREIHEARVCTGCSDGWEAGFDPDRCDCDYPARVLREVEAKRAILDRHMPHETAFKGLACNWCSDDVDDRPQLAKVRWPCPDVRDLAAIWSDHPDYDPAWAPAPVAAG
jgi:Family of unknown function (DUF6221)